MSRRMEIPLRDLGCSGGTASTIERAIAGLPGVSRAYVNAATDIAYLDVDETTFDIATIRGALADVGVAVREGAPRPPGDLRGVASTAGCDPRGGAVRLDVLAFGLAAGTAAALLFTLCAIAVVIAPDRTMSASTALFHLDLSGLAATLTWSGYLLGLAAWGIGTALLFAGAARLYNRWAAQVPEAADAELRQVRGG